MKRSGFKKPTFAEALIKQSKARDRLMEKKRKERNLPKKKVRKKVSEYTEEDKIRILKKKLWTKFSQYIRKSYANHEGYVQTSDGKLRHWKNTDCGHLFPNTERNSTGGGNELWYVEDNFAPQSVSGNRFNEGDSAKVYTLWAIEKYGLERIKELEALKKIGKKWSLKELQEKYEYISDKFDKL